MELKLDSNSNFKHGLSFSKNTPWAHQSKALDCRMDVGCGVPHCCGVWVARPEFYKLSLYLDTSLYTHIINRNSQNVYKLRGGWVRQYCDPWWPKLAIVWVWYTAPSPRIHCAPSPRNWITVWYTTPSPQNWITIIRGHPRIHVLMHGMLKTCTLVWLCEATIWNVSTRGWLLGSDRQS